MRKCALMEIRMASLFGWLTHELLGFLRLRWNLRLRAGVYYGVMIGRSVIWTRRLAAVLLLLWAFCDLTVPGLCQSDATEFSAVSAQTHSQNVTPSVSAKEHSGSNPWTVNSATDSDDCWCCCSHIVPGTVSFSLVALHPVAGPLDLYRSETPQWRSLELFQPPKA